MTLSPRYYLLLFLLFFFICQSRLSAQQGCNLSQIRSALTGAGCTELNTCLSSCSIYFYNPQTQSGSAAQAFAQTYGANLISLQSAAENTCIVNDLNAKGFSGVIWIGFNDEAVEGSFVWYDSSPVTYTNWAGGEPNQAGNEDCVQIYPGGQWNDLSCASANSSSVIEVNLCPVTNAGVDKIICAGQSTTLSIASTLFGSFPYTYLWSPGGQTTSSITVAPAITTPYYVTATDKYGCYTSDTVTVTVVGYTINPSQVNVSCFNGSDGSASLNITGGTAPFSFTWSPNVSTGSTATSLTAGTYNVTATDISGCSKTNVFTTTQPTVLQLTPSQTNVSCFGGSNGAAKLNASGGTIPYSYSWVPNVSTSDSASGLASGNYSVTITDNKGCTQFNVFTISAPTVLQASGSVTNVSCNGKSDGSANIIVTGGVSPYSYAWAPSVSSTTFSATGLVAGNYTVTVTDNNACTDTAAITVTEPSPLVLAVGSKTNAKCKGDCNGSATITASGSGTSYTYMWNNPGSTASATATGLCAGTYTITVTDNKGCTNTLVDSISEPSLLTAAVTPINVTCFGLCNGKAVATPSGGSPPYKLLWIPNPQAGQDSSIATLCAGNDTLQVTDTNGCVMKTFFTITEPPILMADTFSVNADCGQANGKAWVVASGGTTSYKYLWSVNAGSQVTDTASGLAPGNYFVTVSDTNNCTLIKPVTVGNNLPPTAVIVTDSAQCKDSCNGSATVTANGGPGASSYSYLWNNPSAATTSAATGLCAGVYTATVTDAKNCSVTITNTVKTPPYLGIVPGSDTTICISGSAFLTATASAGNGAPFSFLWSNSVTGDTQTVSLSSNSCFSVIAADKKGCPSAMDTQCVFTLPPIIPNAFGDTTVCKGGTALLSASPTGGKGIPYTFYWVDKFGIPVDSAANILVSPANYPDSMIYFVTVKDKCETPMAMDTVTVKFHPNPVPAFTAVDTSGCEPFTVSLKYNSTNTALCYWKFGDGTTDTACGDITHLFKSAGTYDVSLFVTSQFGCKDSLKKIPYIAVQPLPKADYTANPQQSTILNMLVNFSDISSGDSVSKWEWVFYDNDTITVVGKDTIKNPTYDFAKTLSSPYVPQLSDTGLYPVKLLVTTKASCRDSIKKMVYFEGVYYAHIANAFTPDGDGLNDVFFPVGTGINPEDSYKLYIFNRWGKLIFESSRLSDGWDGTAKSVGGGKVPEGVYVWTLELKEATPALSKHKYTGFVTVIYR